MVPEEYFVNKSTFKDENRLVLGLVTVLQDIIDFRIFKKALEENEERYRIVTEQTGKLVYDNNLENNQLSLAGAVEEVFGYGVEMKLKSLILVSGSSISILKIGSTCSKS